jgi:hypothetical protein
MKLLRFNLIFIPFLALSRQTPALSHHGIFGSGIHYFGRTPAPAMAMIASFHRKGVS